MDKQGYNDQIITEYLLGSLPEEETERFDELCITDDAFAERLQVVENELVDAYVRRELTDKTLEQFNSRYLSSPKRRDKVRFAQVFQNAADRTAVTERAESQKRISTESIADRLDSPRRFFSIPRLALQFGLAAVLLLLAAGGWVLFENQRLQRQIDQAQAERRSLEQRERELQSELEKQRSSGSEKEMEGLRKNLARLEQQRSPSGQSVRAHEPNIIAFVLAPQTRGVSQIADIPIPADADYVAMQLELEPSDFTSYRAELKAQPGNLVVWRSGRLRARARGDGKTVVVSLRPALLKSQRYNLEVYSISPTGAAEVIGNYPFRIIKQ